MTTETSIPVLDFAFFRAESPARRQAFAKALVRSFKDYGFVKLINHGLSEKVVRACMQGVRRHFPASKRWKTNYSNTGEGLL